MKFPDLVIYVMKIYVNRFLKKFVRVVSEIYKQAVHLDRWLQNGLVFKIARTKIHQNFLTSKYDVKQHSDAT